MNVGFIGAGNMATALGGAIDASFPDVSFTAWDVSPEQLNRFRAAVTTYAPSRGNAAVAAASDVTFLAVKPQYMADVLPEIAGERGLFVSIAAGLTIAHFETALPEARIVRVMPNAPCLVGEMAAGYAAGARATPEDVELVGRLLRSAGVAFELPEPLLDAVTGLSGSGPAFVARLVAAFTAAGEANGLPHETAYRLALATFSGTARLLAEKGLSPEELVNMVSSKGGTTVAGRAVLEASGYETIIRETVDAAVARSKELGS